MKAEPQVQLRLLDVQGLDLALDRLDLRRRTLPELARLEEIAARLGSLDTEIVTAQTEDRDLGREQTKLEGDVDLVRTRMARDQQRLDTGAVASPRELENLQSEITSLHRRQDELEEQVLELMERREQNEGALRALTAERDALLAERAEVEERRDTAFAEIDDERERTAKERAELASSLPEDLRELYQRIRASSSGIGAAALHRGRCEGCHLQLNTAEVSALRDAPADEVVRCEECRRILVRTAESGL